MKKILIAFCAFLFSTSMVNAQKDQNYWHYHELIYKAECAMFEDGNVDAAFRYYDLAFKKFEFNYVHDLVAAAQMAHFYGRDYMKYLKKAVGYGLRTSHLNEIPAWANSNVIQEVADFEKSKQGVKLRQAYLSSINQEYLAWLYRFSLTEVKIRRVPHGAEYRKMFADWDAALNEKINMYGYPGAKLLGIDDSLLYIDLHNEDLNFNKLVQMSADSLCFMDDTVPFPMVFGEDTVWVQIVNPTYSCFGLNDGYISQTLPVIYFVHNACPIKSFEPLYSEIAKGNLHPREYAYMIDISRGSVNDETVECDCGKFSKMFFRLGNGDSPLWKSFFMPENETDALRKQYWIIPMRVEQAKTAFGEKNGYRFNWGMNNCFK